MESGIITQNQYNKIVAKITGSDGEKADEPEGPLDDQKKLEKIKEFATKYFLRPFPPSHPNTPEGLVMGYIIINLIFLIPQLFVMCQFIRYSCKMEDGELDLSSDRQTLPTGIFILIVKEVLNLVISFILLIIYLGFGPAW